MSDKECCQNCKFVLNDGDFVCRRYPPVITRITKYLPILSRFPYTYRDFWCGEFVENSHKIKKQHGKIKVNIERIFGIKEELAVINRESLEDIEWHEAGRKIEVNPKNIDRFSFTGLNNVDFITSGYFKKE